MSDFLTIFKFFPSLSLSILYPCGLVVIDTGAHARVPGFDPWWRHFNDEFNLHFIWSSYTYMKIKLFLNGGAIDFDRLISN